MPNYFSSGDTEGRSRFGFTRSNGCGSITNREGEGLRADDAIAAIPLGRRHLNCLALDEISDRRSELPRSDSETGARGRHCPRAGGCFPFQSFSQLLGERHCLVDRATGENDEEFFAADSWPTES